MHLTHPHTNSSIAALCFISGRRNSLDRSTHHDRCSASLWTCCRWRGRSSLKAEYLDHPFIPDFAVVCLSVHSHDDFAVVGDVEGGLFCRKSVRRISNHYDLSREATLSGKYIGNQLIIPELLASIVTGLVDNSISPYSTVSKYPANP